MLAFMRPFILCFLQKRSLENTIFALHGWGGGFRHLGHTMEHTATTALSCAKICDMDVVLHPYTFKSHCFDSDRTKVLHIIRHAEGYHNVNDRYRAIENLDARLTPKGIGQCEALASDIEQAKQGSLADLASNVELIVTSPLTRCIDTALLSLENVIATRKPAIVAHESIRETVNYNCDRRRPLSNLSKEYPMVDFTHIETDHDHIWAMHVDQLGCDKTWMEPRDSAALHVVAERGRTFFRWLQSRPERSVAICTHSAFLRCILNYGLADRVPLQPPQTLDTRAEPTNIPVVQYGSGEKEEHEQLREDFVNCELRSMIVNFRS